MRSAGSTYLGLDFSVVSLTNARVACFAGASFQDGSGSWACAFAVPNRRPNSATNSTPLEASRAGLRLIIFPLRFCRRWRLWNLQRPYPAENDGGSFKVRGFGVLAVALAVGMLIFHLEKV